ncbi:MAG: ABC transporter permease subunit [Bdellovibrionota bacterium]
MNTTLVFLRLRLLLRQKIGWLSLLAGLFFILVGYTTATISFVSPAKIFWDFALGLSFVLVHLLGLYLAAQLFHDEKERRTLHLVLVSGVSRSRWLVANILGIFLGLMVIEAAWFGMTEIMGVGLLESWGGWIVVQAKLLQAMSLLIVLSYTALFSLMLRPLLALILSLSLTVFLYSMSSIERVFSDELSGAFVNSTWALSVIKIAKFLPPLEWFDLKMFVGYHDQIAWSTVGLTMLLGLAWSALLLGLASWRFSRLDL